MMASTSRVGVDRAPTGKAQHWPWQPPLMLQKATFFDTMGAIFGGLSKANAKFSPTPGGPTPTQICTPNPAQNGVRGMAVARGAVAENSVLVQFLCCGARKNLTAGGAPHGRGGLALRG